MCHQAVSAMKICPLCSLQAWHTVGPQSTLVERMMGLRFTVSREGAEKRRASWNGTEQPAEPSWKREQWAGKRGQEDCTEGSVASEASADTACVLRPTSHSALPTWSLASSILHLKLNRRFCFPSCSVKGVPGNAEGTL